MVSAYRTNIKDGLTARFKECFNSGMDTNAVIDTLGGTNKVADLCEVRPQAVSQWRTSGIPKARLLYLKLLRPDVFEHIDADGSSLRGNTPVVTATAAVGNTVTPVFPPTEKPAIEKNA